MAVSIKQLKPYADYATSPVPWAPRLPSHWLVRRGKRLFAESKLPVRNDDEIITCFRDGQVTLRRNRRTSGFMVALKEAGYQGVRRGQLVIHAMDAFAGAIGVADSSGKCTPEYIVCDPRDGRNSPSYFSRALRVAAQTDFIQVSCSAVRERAPRLRYPNFGSMLLPVPPPDEQAAIIRFLDSTDLHVRRYMRARQRTIRLLEEQRQVIIHRVVTQGLTPGVMTKASGVPWLGEIPAHWTVARGKFLFRKVLRKVRPDDEVVTCFRDGTVTLRRSRRTSGFTVAIHEHGYQGIRRGDLVIHAMDAFAGAAGVADCDGKATPVYVVCVPRDSANPYYYAHVIREMARRLWILALGRGIRERSTDFRFEAFATQRLPVPSHHEQAAIVSYIQDHTSDIARAIEMIHREIELTRELRTRLIADVVTGQLDVRAAAAALPDEPTDDEPLDDADETPDEDDPDTTDPPEEDDA